MESIMEITNEPFYGSYPCYILATDYTIDPSTGSFRNDEKLRYITPGFGPSQEPVVALFTDLHAAEDYLEQIGEEFTLRALPIPSAVELKSFLLRAKTRYRLVGVDPNPKTG